MKRLINQFRLEEKRPNQWLIDVSELLKIHAIDLFSSFRKEVPFIIGHKVSLAKTQGYPLLV